MSLDRGLFMFGRRPFLGYDSSSEQFSNFSHVRNKEVKTRMFPTETFISTNGLRMHLRDWGGPAGATLPILLVHGLASNARIWDLTAPALTREFRTIAINQRGHGRSSKPDDGYDFATVTHDLAEAIGVLGLAKPLVVGHSWGANVALQLASDRPDLLAGIVLVDGGVGDMAAAMSLEETLERLAPPRLAGTPRPIFLENLRNRWLGALWSPEVETIVMGNFAVDADDRIAPHLSFDNHLKVLRAIWEQRPSSLFSRVAAPTLIIPAEPEPPLDEINAQWLERKRQAVAHAAATIPDALVVWAHNSVHDVPLHHPYLLSEQIAEFARKLAGRMR